jgi:hypothetical protein
VPSEERGELKELAENYGWLFVDIIPLLYDKRRVARQLQIETWLDLNQLVKELGIEKIENKTGATSPIGYVI